MKRRGFLAVLGGLPLVRGMTRNREPAAPMLASYEEAERIAARTSAIGAMLMPEESAPGSPLMITTIVIVGDVQVERIERELLDRRRRP